MTTAKQNNILLEGSKIYKNPSNKPQNTYGSSGKYNSLQKNLQFNIQGFDDSSKVVIFSNVFSGNLIEKSLNLWLDQCILYTRMIWKKIYRKINSLMCFAIKSYSAFTQFCSWFIIWPIFNLFFKIKIEGRENLKGLRSPLIMVSNHIKFYDSFLFRLAVGPFSRLLPMRFMAVTKFIDPFMNTMNKIGVVPFIYSLFGVFTIEQGQGLQKNLYRAKAIIKNKGIIAMFPEGKISRDGKIGMFKRGVSALALSTHTKVLPIGMSISDKKITIKIGRADYLETGKTYEELAEDLRRQVEELRDRR